MIMGIEFKIFILMVYLLSVFTDFSVATELTGQDIIERMVNRDTGNDFTAYLEIVLTNKAGKEKKQKVTIQRKGSRGETKILIRFTSPATLEGTGFLVWSNKDRNDDPTPPGLQWLPWPFAGSAALLPSKGQYSEKRLRYK